MPTLRDYQVDIVQRSYAAWQGGAKNVMAVAPTGAGKTVITAHIIVEFNEPTTHIAHRAELVAQASVALAKQGLRHRIIGPEKLEKIIQRRHIKLLDADYTHRHAKVAVAGVDTLIRMSPQEPLFNYSRLVSIDEGHHVLKKNKWGRAFAMFNKGCYSFLPTATPCRADGQGLGADSHGIVDVLVEGPTLRNLIDRGYSCDYRVFMAKSDLDRAQLHMAASGDFEPKEMAKAVKKSSITGDVVKTHVANFNGMLTIVFAADIEHAGQVGRGLRAAGIKAEVVTGEADADTRDRILAKFEAREITVLVNVDLFGEGFDLPSVQVVQMARPTESESLYRQQTGRAARVEVMLYLAKMWHTFSDAQRKAYIAASEKPNFFICDHVGNVLRHGLPDRLRAWTLEPRSSKSQKDDVPPMRVCVKCAGAYERFYKSCPYCKHVHIPPERGSIEIVDGDMGEVSPEILAKMRGDIDHMFDLPSIPQHLDIIAQRGIANRHHEMVQAQLALRATMELWGGWQTHLGRSIDEAWRRFFHTFKIDVGTAQTLRRADADALRARIDEQLRIDGIVKKG